MALKSKDKPDAGDSGDAKKKGWKGAAATVRDTPTQYVPAYEDIVEAPRRIVAATAGLQKRGKTRFAMTLPKPLAYLQLDANYEHALAQARLRYPKKGDIQHLKYFADPRTDIRSANQAVFERLMRDFDYCVKNFRGVIVDTATELMDVRKLAEYGRNTQIPQIYYGSIYADFRWMVKHALDHDANVLFLHRLKDEWAGGDRTGNYVMDGWKGIQFEAQMYLEHSRDTDGNFITNIVECAQDAMLMGMTLSSADDDNDFPGLATRVFPETSREDWE